jgi:hypothetical protein
MSIKFYNKPDPSVLEQKYTNIPNEIHDHPTLGIQAKMLLWTLLRYSTCPNFTHHDSTIRKFMECGQNKLEKAFARAVRAGFVYNERVHGAGGKITHTIRHFAKYPKWSRNGEGAYACAICADETCAFCQDARQKDAQNPCATRDATTAMKTMGMVSLAKANHGVLINTDLPLPITDKNNNAHSANARSCLDEEFDKFYGLFPKKKDKARGKKAFMATRKTVSMEILMEGLAKWRASDTPVKFWPLPASWLNGKRWEDEMDVPAKGGSVADEIKAYVGSAPRMHKTEEETKQELDQFMPPTKADPNHVSSLMESLKKDLKKQNMEKLNVRDNRGRTVPKTECALDGLTGPMVSFGEKAWA